MGRCLPACLCVVALLLSSCTSARNNSAPGSGPPRADGLAAYLRVDAGISERDIPHDPPVGVAYSINSIDGQPVTGTVAGHPIVDTRCFSPVTQSFWQFETRGSRVTRATSDAPQLSGHWIEFATLTVSGCPVPTQIATYRDRTRIYGVVVSNPRGAAACDFAWPVFMRLQYVRAGDQVVVSLREFEFGGKKLSGEWGFVPVQNEQGEWVSPSEAIGEYIRVTDPKQSCVIRGVAQDSRMGKYVLFAGPAMQSRAQVTAAGEGATEWRPSARSIEPDIRDPAGKNQPEIKLKVANPYIVAPLHAPQPSGPGYLIFGRILRPGRPPGPWELSMGD